MRIPKLLVDISREQQLINEHIDHEISSSQTKIKI